MVDFQNLRKQVLKDNHLSTDYFGETFTFHPAGGVARTITGHISETQDSQIDNANEETIEEIVVTVLRDADDADNGGIAQVKLGDAITRAPEYDPNPLRFVFAGQIRERHPYKWKLVFIRYIQTQQGPRR